MVTSSLCQKLKYELVCLKHKKASVLVNKISPETEPYSEPHTTWRTSLPVQDSVIDSGMWWDGLWCSLKYTQMLFGKALDMSPWDCVQPFQNLLMHRLCIYLQKATFLTYPSADSVYIDSHFKFRALLFQVFLCWEACVQEYSIHQYLQPTTPNTLTQQNPTFQYQFLI